LAQSTFIKNRTITFSVKSKRNVTESFNLLCEVYGEDDGVTYSTICHETTSENVSRPPGRILSSLLLQTAVVSKRNAC